VDVRCEIRLDVPVDVAFAYYCDENRLQEWVTGGACLEFTPISPAPKGVGSRYRMVYRLMGIVFTSVAEVKAFDRWRCVKEQVSGDYRTWRYDMRMSPTDDGGSRMAMHVHADLPWGAFGIVAGWVARPLVQRDRQACYRRFKAQVESRHSEFGLVGASGA